MQAGLVQGDKVPEEYEALVQPHVDSFDYFLGEGMELVVDSMEQMEVRRCWPALERRRMLTAAGSGVLLGAVALSLAQLP